VTNRTYSGPTNLAAEGKSELELEPAAVASVGVEAAVAPEPKARRTNLGQCTECNEQTTQITVTFKSMGDIFSMYPVRYFTHLATPP